MVQLNNEMILALNMPIPENLENKRKTKEIGTILQKGIANRAKLSRKLCQNYSSDSLVKSVAGATKNVLNLMAH
jgi:hypothetical protein